MNELTTLKEREHEQNRKFTEALFGVDRRFLGSLRTKEKIFTEQEVVEAIAKCHDEKISEEDARTDIRKYVGDERNGMSLHLGKLALLRDDTLGINHVRAVDGGEKRYKIFTYSRDPGFT